MVREIFLCPEAGRGQRARLVQRFRRSYDSPSEAEGLRHFGQRKDVERGFTVHRHAFRF